MNPIQKSQLMDPSLWSLHYLSFIHHKEPYEIHLVSSENVVGARAALARSASFQALLVGLFNVDSDYFMLVVVTYLGVHLMISHGSPVVEQVSLVKFVMSCFAVLLVFIKLSRFPPIFILLPDVII
ncbi:hypothetical protein IGI04_000767 [Brassica rapa subsp. trilocularis]|uniref:Sugar phosphate transporter domain-containing protein n=1 Tax=Brassica rapa subsp. trilocularis TaxID=1813537 RepID=A0ABQ7NSZ1_BRACM|nr:hypothetical protein IGI04_000767 [Brassica rapa subsp. trilocularis]